MVMIVMMATSTWEIETRSAGSGVPTSKVSSGKLSWYCNKVREIKCKYQKIKLNKKKKHQYVLKLDKKKKHQYVLKLDCYLRASEME